MQFNKIIVRLAAFAVLVVVPALSACAADSSGAHVFARHDNGTNIVSRLVPDGTDVATAGMISGFAQYYPDGSVKSSAEFTPGIKYNFDTTNHTATVKPFCDTDTADNDNSSLIGRVVIPPYVDEHGNPYVADDGTRFKVTALTGDDGQSENTNLTAIVAPTSVVDIGYGGAFDACAALVSVTFPSVTNVGYRAFYACTALVSVKIPNATDIGVDSFAHCYKLASVSLPAATSVGNYAFNACRGLTSVDFGDTPRSSVPTLGTDAFRYVQTPCKIIVPDAQYNAWITTSGWSDLVTHGYKFLKHSEWDYAHRYEIDQLLFKQYYPEGNVKSASEFTTNILYTLTSNATERTAKVKPFCNTGVATNDNSSLIGRVVIPPFVDASGNGYISDDGTRYKVTGLMGADSAPYSNIGLTSVVAPNTVTTVGNKVFILCTKLTSVSLPAVMTIMSGAFYNCTALASVSLPAATSVGSHAFNSCTKLASVSLPATTSVGDSAFNNCNSLASVSLPAAESIGTYAFNSCTKLASVSIPAATNIRNYAFYSCTKLTSVSIPAAKSIGGHVFDACTKLASVSLPAATSVGGSAFNNCNSLASVSLPVVTSIDGYSFAGCTSLTSVDFGETLSSAPTLGSNAFSSVPTSCKIIVPDAQYDAWIAASGWSSLVTRGYKFLRHSEWEYVRRYELDPLLFAQYYPEGNVKSVDEFTLGIKYDAPDTTNRTITVNTFCNTDTATDDNSSLSGRVVIPPFVDASGNGYISDDGTRLRVVGIGGGPPELDNSGLTAIVAPNTVTNVGNNAFSNCGALTSVSLPAATSIGSDVFVSCGELTSVSLPAATTIGDEAFIFCPRLASVSLPAATNIGDKAFDFCRGLTSVDFGDTPRSSVPTLGTDAFRNVTNTCKITVPYTQYNDWIAADVWKDLQQEFVRHAEKADKPATFTVGNLAALDANGNPADSGVPTNYVAGLVQASRTVNGKPLTNDVTLTAADIPLSGTVSASAQISGPGSDGGGTPVQPATVAEALDNKVSLTGGVMYKGSKITWSDGMAGGTTYSISDAGVQRMQATNPLLGGSWTKSWDSIVDVGMLASKADVTIAGAPQFGTNDFWVCWDGTVLRCDTDRTGDLGNYRYAVWVGTNKVSSIWRYQYPTETMLKYSCEKTTGDYEWTCYVTYSAGAYAGDYVTRAAYVGGTTQYVYPEVLSESPSGEMATNIDFGVSYPEDGVELHLPIIRKADSTVVYSDQLAAVAGKAVRTPTYDGDTANHVFMDASGTNAVDAAVSGFNNKDAAHRWTAQRRCVVYVRVVGSGSGKSVVYAHVNNQDAPTDDTSHLLFKHAFTDGAGMVVPVYLNKGDSLDLRVTDNNLSQLQYSVFYTD